MNIDWQNKYHVRKVLGAKLWELGGQYPECVVLTADLARTCNVVDFRSAYPKRFLNLGIAEQNMTSVAAGLAYEGKKPWITSIAPFVTLRNCEQVRTDICYNKLHVVIVSIMAGISGAPLGCTHYATEDIGVLRSMANMSVLCPADQHEIESAMELAMEASGPVYIRLGSDNEPQIPIDREEVSFGHAFNLKDGNDVSILATGYMVHKALDTADILESKGISVAVWDHVCLKPFDRESVINSAQRARLLVTMEEHNIVGGLGSAVAEVLAESGSGVPLIRLAFNDVFVGVGEREDLLCKHGLNPETMAQKVERFIRSE